MRGQVESLDGMGGSGGTQGALGLVTPRCGYLTHYWAGWQIPSSILIGVLEVGGGLVVLRIRSKQQLGDSTQAV
jgi:hypothetical protein